MSYIKMAVNVERSINKTVVLENFTHWQVSRFVIELQVNLNLYMYHNQVLYALNISVMFKCCSTMCKYLVGFQGQQNSTYFLKILKPIRIIYSIHDSWLTTKMPEDNKNKMVTMQDDHQIESFGGGWGLILRI